MRVVVLLLLLIFAAIVVGLAGFVVSRLAGYGAAAPVFGTLLQGGVIAFAVLLGCGLLVGAHHTIFWLVRSVLGKPAPSWGGQPKEPPGRVDSPGSADYLT